jgi:hypothetical protein
MATKNSNSEPVGDKVPKSSQQHKPAPEPFPECEWAFHKIRRQSELRYCAMWELARLQGAEQKPWLELTDDAKAEFISAEHCELLEIPDTIGHVLPDPDSALKVITFLVDFGRSEVKLLEAFRRWLRSSPHRKHWRKNPKPPKERWRSLLAKIVILRATEVGLTRKAAIKTTSDLWVAWTTKGVEDGLTSAPHWSRALAEAEALRERKPTISVSRLNGFMFRWAFSQAANRKAKLRC